MHQPNYREPRSGRLAMPWVRLHALKDYLDMPLIAAAADGVRVTFNLVPSLLDQLEFYLAGGTDRHLELSALSVESLTDEQKHEILRTFFAANPQRMIQPYRRYRELYQKYRSGTSDPRLVAGLFTSQEFRDLQVWSNLVWIDPLFRDEAPVRELFARGRHFTEEEKGALLTWERDLIGRIIPTYRRLQDEGRIEVSFTPYYHPILPLLCDTDAAREALPTVGLPRSRFAHPEDADRQIAMAVARYEEVFGRPMVGMWPSEGSVSEEALALAARHGIRWSASDEEVLEQSLEKSGLDKALYPIHQVYEFGPGLKLLFRDHALSDRVGFVYSTWDAERAVVDFIAQIKRLRQRYGDRLGNTVVPVILDGENAWEYFAADGTEFLKQLYAALAEDPEIETVTMSQAIETLPATRLPRIFAGSWINHNFRVWIGHREDNAAWDLLSRTRLDLVAFQAQNPGFDPQKLEAAWRQIYVAEGSDWCWWYGDDHRSSQNDQFDRIFRQHLIAVYEILGLDIPFDHLRVIHQSGEEVAASRPDGVVTPVVDGLLTHFYEWAGAGFYDCRRSGSSMHQVERQVAGIYFAFDRDRVYIRLDFRSREEIQLLEGLRAVVRIHVDDGPAQEFPIKPGISDTPGQSGYAFRDIAELWVQRSVLWPAGHGRLGLNVMVFEGDQLLETWPEHEPMEFEVPEDRLEMFWPL